MAKHKSLGAFGQAMLAKAGQVEGETARLMRELAFDFVSNVAPATPIKSGQAQSNWITWLGQNPPQLYKANDQFNDGAKESIDMALRVLANVRHDSEIHIVNNVPYIAKLNRGTSKQAPALFVQTTLLASRYKFRGFKISLQ